MTLREKSFEIPQRRYSVSNSGRYKSRNKVRPSLSGDLFRPDPEQLKQLESIYNPDPTTPSPRGPPQEVPTHYGGPMQNVTAGPLPAGNPQQHVFYPPPTPPSPSSYHHHQQHHQSYHSHQPQSQGHNQSCHRQSKEVFETAL